MKNKKINSVFDISKIILSIMIVIIHTSLLSKVFYPWVRVAVPLFFIISSFFLFSKLENVDDVEKKKVLINFVIRNLKLYFFWFIILLPITLKLREYFIDQSIFKGILILLRDFFFGGTFAASWFIMALIISSIIIYYASKKANIKLLFCITILIYVIITLRNTYSFLLPDNFVNSQFIKYYSLVIKYSYNSFLVAFIWVLFGKLFVLNTFKWSRKVNIWLFIGSLLGLYIEWYIVGKITNYYTYDCYIMLMPLCISVFWFIKDIKISYEKTVLLRKLSTIIYVTHASIVFLLKDRVESSLLKFVITILICLVIFIVVNYMSNKKYFKWLKNAF